ncbi:inositol phosphorylceramide synthase [Aeromicrobium sp. A1-2]|uniref:phosphatase PAP2 family protein n=1 Tax=Aeromicrobium sp. A1-2 TaxID=2107713 RepID=UPI000E495634|nr:phosphatase PAP2 family protein [Aeromicrobium sp. A1-2]AXT83770.1 inositol phosphorylceramide synthase [Aeromicrobium sp. A1-2]
MSTLTGHGYGPARATTPSSRGAGTPMSTAQTRAAVRRRVRLASGLGEVALLATLWIAYSVSRLVADDNLVTAQSRATELLRVERYLHLDFESWLNHALTPIMDIAVPMSFWYASLHYVVTPAVLAYAFFRQRAHYPRARNALVIGSAIGLVCYMLLPTAPPRLMPGGHYLDALAQTARFGWWTNQASAPAGLGHITNELAAMPSLHVGWTVWVAWAIWRHTNLVGRVIACAYVAGTTLVVIATGNHWVLDAVAGAVVVTAGIVITGRLELRANQSARAGT